MKGKKVTKVYFSGELAAEDFLKQHPGDFPGTGVLLSFYTLRGDGKSKSKRRLKKLIKERN